MRISVVIPCFDAEAHLAAAIRSALDQTLAPAEVLVVDNGSRDGSVAVAEAFGHPVRVLHETRKGAAAARATGAAAASGEALLFLDADDLMGPDALEHLAAALGQAGDAIAVCPWRRLEAKGPCWIVAPESCPPRAAGSDPLVAWLGGWYHPPCAVLWSRAAYEASGGWDAAVAVNQDGDVTMRALAAGVPLVETAKGCSYYRRHAAPETTVSGKRLTRDGLAARLGVLERLEGRLEGAAGTPERRMALAQAALDLAAEAEPVDAALVERARALARRLGGGRSVRHRRLVGRRRSPHVGPSTAGEAAPRDKPHAPDFAPPVSVVIPAYNCERLVKRALATVTAQTYGNVEVLVVDDASTDDTAGSVRACSDPRVRLVSQPVNGGVAAARNRGVAEAKGDFVAFLDCDDEWKPDKLARQVAAFAGAPGRVGLVYSGVENRHRDGRVSVFRPQVRGFAYETILARNVLHGAASNALIRRCVFDVVGGMDPTFAAIEDHEWFARVLRFFAVEFVEEPLSVYHDESLEADGALRRSRNFAANMTAREQFRRRFHDDLAAAGLEHAYLLDSADRHLASRDGDRRAAALLLLRALKRRPGETGDWVRLARCAVPPGTGARLRAAVGQGRKPPNARSLA